MTSHQKLTEADFAYFDTTAYEQNAARKLSEASPSKKQQEQQPMRVVQRQKKSVAQARREMALTAHRAFKAVAVAGFLLTLFAVLLYNRVRVDEITRTIDNTNVQLGIAQSENVRLNAQLAASVSLDSVEEYAKNTLGMTKIEGYQIEHIDLSGQDRVTHSGAKEKDDREGGFLEDIKAYLQAK